MKQFIKKNIKKIAISLMLILAIVFSAGCYGKFGLTKKVYSWNGTFGNKFINTVVMWGLNIIPVYPIAFVADLLLLNLVEFWTGSNPIAMNAGDKEIKVVEKDGNTFEITATQNKFSIKVLAGEAKYKSLELNYNPDTQAWYSSFDGSAPMLIASLANENTMVLNHPDGSKVLVNL